MRPRVLQFWRLDFWDKRARSLFSAQAFCATATTTASAASAALKGTAVVYFRVFQLTASRHLPDCQRDPALAGVAAAAARQLQGTADDDQAFQAIMEEIATLPVGTVTHVPRAVCSTLAVVLSDYLRAARVEGIWGFVRLSMLAKAVLRSPPRGGRRKRCCEYLHCRLASSVATG